jgi:hypothetical protein
MKRIPLLALPVAAMLASCTTIYFDFTIYSNSGTTTTTSSSSSTTASTSSTTLCTPGEVQSCYDGPGGTEGQGICKAGTQTCADDGASWGPCEGEVLPKPEDCATPEDEDCDGKAPACKGTALWAKRFGDASAQTEALAVAVDDSGNVLVAGYFEGTVDFGGGPLTSPGTSLNVFVLKLDPSGGYLWAKSFGDANVQLGQGLAVDGSGNVVVTGDFAGTVDFGGGPLTSPGTGHNVFVLKLAANGDYLWAKGFGDANSQSARSIAADVSGNVLVTGRFAGTMDFGGGPLKSAGGYDVFAAKLSPNGDYLWAKNFGDANDQEGKSIAADSSGNVLVTGAFAGAVDFGGGSLQSAGGNDAFVVKLDPNGGYLWAKRFGDAYDQSGEAAAADGEGNILLAGELLGSADFGGGAVQSAGGRDIFVVKLDPSGGYLWAKRFGDAKDQSGRSVAADGLGNVLLAGVVNGSADFGDGPLQSAGGGDAFVAKLDPSGGYLWAKRFGDGQAQEATGVVADTQGNVLLAGYFSGLLDFGLANPLISAGVSDMFVAKLSP